ncbi:MAG: tyrosine transporter [Verrucomicrobia bacterium]|nr:tyrosine transporter [Verrucomicrobiota bacterium]
MKKENHLLGGVLLIAGTSIGAGMLALPIVTSFGGFFPSFCLFTIIWALMLATAFFFLDVNLAVKGEPNFISMTGKTLGKTGKVVCWIFYLLLLYALLAAYISACSPLFSSAFLSLFSFSIPSFIPPFFLPIIFGGFIYLGTQGIDYLNRILMIGLIVSYFLLTGSLPVHIEPIRFMHNDFLASLLAAPIIITSFGYHIIIPTLTTYMGHQARILRKTILIGSIIPFIIYLLWEGLVLGAVPLTNLTEAWTKGVAATDPLSTFLKSNWISSVASFFSFFAIITSFLGISLSLSDFLTDGLKIKKTRKGKWLAIVLTFVPPLLFIFSHENSFYTALDYAGAFVAILLGVLPCLMVLTLKNHRWYQSLYGKATIYFIMLLFLGVIIINILEKQGVFAPHLLPYLQQS